MYDRCSLELFINSINGRQNVTILCRFQQELVPFAMTILQLYQQTLKWTDKIGDNQTTISGGKPFKNVRIAVYKSLTTWLSSMGALSGIEIVSEEFLAHLLKDITPEKERVLLTVSRRNH